MTSCAKRCDEHQHERGTINTDNHASEAPRGHPGTTATRHTRSSPSHPSRLAKGGGDAERRAPITVAEPASLPSAPLLPTQCTRSPSISFAPGPLPLCTPFFVAPFCLPRLPLPSRCATQAPLSAPHLRLHPRAPPSQAPAPSPLLDLRPPSSLASVLAFRAMHLSLECAHPLPSLVPSALNSPLTASSLVPLTALVPPSPAPAPLHPLTPARTPLASRTCDCSMPSSPSCPRPYRALALFLIWRAVRAPVTYRPVSRIMDRWAPGPCEDAEKKERRRSSESSRERATKSRRWTPCTRFRCYRHGPCTPHTARVRVLGVYF